MPDYTPDYTYDKLTALEGKVDALSTSLDNAHAAINGLRYALVALVFIICTQAMLLLILF